MVTIAMISNAMMYFLYRFQMKKTNVFMGFTNQLKDVLGRLEEKEHVLDRCVWGGEAKEGFKC